MITIKNLTLTPNTIERKRILTRAEIEICGEDQIALPASDFATLFDVDADEVFVADFYATIMRIPVFRSLVGSTYAVSSTLTTEDVKQVISLAIYVICDEGCDWMKVRNKFFVEVRRELQQYRDNPRNWNESDEVQVIEFNEEVQEILDESEEDWMDVALRNLDNSLTVGEIESINLYLSGIEKYNYEIMGSIQVKLGLKREVFDAELIEACVANPGYGYRKIASLIMNCDTVYLSPKKMSKLRSMCGKRS